ncbi:hypothetical protein ScPMuIL_007933 [Solemya velum]
MRPMKRFLSSLLCFIVFQTCFCLYEDQIGKFDWRQQYVGKVETTYWDQAGKRILVATERNVIASLSSHNGSIVWRQIFEEGPRGQIDAFLHQDKTLLSVCGGGHYIRSWNSQTGSLMWEAVGGQTDNGRYGWAIISLTVSEQLLLSTSDEFFSFDVSNGKQLWKENLPNEDNSLYEFIVPRGDIIFIIGISPGSHVSILESNLKGQLNSERRTVPATWVSQNTGCDTVADNFLLCYSSGSQSLQLLDFVESTTFVSITLQDIGLKVDSQVRIERLPSSVRTKNSYVLLRFNPDHVAVVRPSSNGITLVKDLPGVSISEMNQLDDHDVLLTLGKISPEEIKLTGYELGLGGEMAGLSQIIKFSGNHGLPVKMNALLFRKKDGRTAHRITMLSEDYSLQLLQKSGQNTFSFPWVREEALSHILAAEMVDLPVSENQAKFEEEFGSQEDDIITMFLKRFSTQISQLHTFTEHFVHKLLGNRHHHSQLEEEEELIRDEFNLNKIIIMATAAGKIYAMQSWNTEIVWQHFLPDLSPFNRYGEPNLLLYTQRTTAHFPHPPQYVVIGRNKKSGRGMVFAFNPITGEALNGQPSSGLHLNYELSQAAILAEMDEHFLKPVLLIDTEHKVYAFPETTSKVIEQTVTPLFLYLTDIDSGMMSGFKVSSRNAELVADKVWHINLQRKQQVITNVVGKRTVEHVHSQGRVLGDRSVLYKYLNPNLVVVTAEGEESGAALQKGPSNFVNIYLVDAITGHILFHATHHRAKGPINIVHSENWIVYNYFNQKNRRHEIAVLELYEGKEQTNSTAFSSFTAQIQPLVMRQSYIFPMQMSAIATTITEKGITNKNLIIALKLGGILSLPKALLDPRRPVMPTPETMEEGTIPYIPEIPVNTEAILNYNQSLYAVRHIHTAPAGLESTSLVLAYGLDIFFTRVTPSKMFDVLKEDFDYFFISVVLGMMTLVSFVSQKCAQRKALSRAWK